MLPNLIVIGAGSAGLVAAYIAATVRASNADLILFVAAAHGPDKALHDLEGFHYLHEDQFALASRWPVRK